MGEKFKESLDFVVKFYREGAFRESLDFGIPHIPWWKRHIAAASAAAVIIVASAAALTYYSMRDAETQHAPVSTEIPADIRQQEKSVSKVIEFNDAPLSKVVEEIESVYGVEVVGEPANTDIRLTLRYEGTASDLVETINELTGTNLLIKE